MQSNFNNRDFERFLKQNADQYRMIPSEKVWEGINNTLHTRRRRWLGFGLALLLITSSLVTWVMLLPGNKEMKQAYLPASSNFDKAALHADNKPADASKAGPVKPKENKDQFIDAPNGLQEDFFAITAPGSTEMNSPDFNNDVTVRPVTNSAIRSAATVPQYTTGPASLKQQNRQLNGQQINFTLATPAITQVTAMPDGMNKADKLADAVTPDPSKKDIADDERMPAITERIAKNSTQKLAKKSLKWQLYITPTVSYRTLSENIDFLAASRYNNTVNGGPAVYYPTDINTMVNHRPDLGFQLGVRAAYPVSRWFSLTGGFQFSVSKYDIKAYDHPAEVATIALRDRSVSTVSSYRNTNGYKENWLRNFYFSASIPLGAELKLSDGNKNYFGVAASLQPTYVLDNRAYLISADYKNYAEMPSLTRKWNLNTSFEIFSAHTTGKVNWRVGPQVRYQVMSSFVQNYPIKEHLFDFGLKLGIQLK